MDIREAITLIANLGFAVGVGTYLVFWITHKLNSKLDRLTGEMARLNDNIDLLVRTCLGRANDNRRVKDTN